MVKDIKRYDNKYIATLILLAAFVSCTTNDNIDPEPEVVTTSSESFCDVKGKRLSEELSSRSALSLGNGEMVFAWESGDELTVMAQGDVMARQIYRLTAGVGSPKATFYTENFMPKTDKLYYAFGMSESNNKHVTIADQNNISVHYDGQIQVGNASTKHLGAYDFLGAAALCTNESAIQFSFSHFGATLRVVMKFDPTLLEGGSDERKALEASTDPDVSAEDGSVTRTRFTEMEIYDSENSFRQTERYFSFAEGTSDDAKSYTFKWPEQEISQMDRFKLTFMNQEESQGTNEHPFTGLKGITRFDQYNDGGTNKNYRIIGYMEVPPADFTNKDVVVMLKGYYNKKEDGVWKQHDVSYVAKYNSGWLFNDATIYSVEPGTACQISNITMKKPDKFDVSLKINHMWQHGSTLDNSRATGDPGYDKEIFKPSHIYYIYCHDGKVVLPTSDATHTVTHITNATWDTKNNNGVYISTFKSGDGNTTGIITLDKPDCKKTPTKDDNCEYHLYVVASKEAIPESYFSTVVADASEEAVVRALTYDLPGTVSGTDKQPASDIQVFMRDLYSTPWDDVSFVGDLTDPIQDVILYHVAAKVDLEWNSTTAINTVSVNDVKNSGLYMFQPTMNTYASGSYTETKDLTTDVNLWYNGRTSFYLPQYVNSLSPSSNCKYNVTLGGSSPEDITFDNLSTEGGFTSWLRWLKQK